MPTLQESEELALRAARRLQTLAEVSRAFAEVATDYQRLLDRVVASAVNLIGDGCLVTLVAADGETLVNAANGHRDPAIAEDYRTFLAASPPNKLSDEFVAARVARTGTASIVPTIAPEAVVARTPEALKPVAQRLNVHGFMVVPIPTGGKTIGTLSLLRSQPGQPYTDEDVTLLRDIADRAGLAIENARHYEQLERRVQERTRDLQELNQELEAFSYSVAHDLRAPLRAITGFSTALLEDLAGSLDDRSRRHLQLVVSGAERMDLLLDGLLELSRVTRAQLATSIVDLSKLALDVLGQLQAAEATRQVVTRVQPALTAHGDERLLMAMLQNLIGNAWKFTRQRESAHIEVGQAESEHPTFFVRDNGAGFDMRHAEKLFAPFQRLHAPSDYEGTGIGLATVQRIVRRHGGRIWAEGAENAGATFYFTLPQPATKVREAKEATHVESAVTRPLRVLLVEDSELDAALLLHVLARAGYDVTDERVQSKSQFESALQRPWDICLSDFSVPGFGGLDALRILRASGKPLPFIVVSGTISEEVVTATIQNGADDFLVKGKLGRMAQAIERARAEWSGEGTRKPLGPEALAAKVQQVWKAVKS